MLPALGPPKQIGKDSVWSPMPSIADAVESITLPKRVVLSGMTIYTALVIYNKNGKLPSEELVQPFKDVEFDKTLTDNLFVQAIRYFCLTSNKTECQKILDDLLEIEVELVIRTHKLKVENTGEFLGTVTLGLENSSNYKSFSKMKMVLDQKVMTMKDSIIQIIEIWRWILGSHNPNKWYLFVNGLLFKQGVEWEEIMYPVKDVSPVELLETTGFDLHRNCLYEGVWHLLFNSRSQDRGCKISVDSFLPDKATKSTGSVDTITRILSTYASHELLGKDKNCAIAKSTSVTMANMMETNLIVWYHFFPHTFYKLLHSDFEKVMNVCKSNFFLLSWLFGIMQNFGTSEPTMKKVLKEAESTLSTPLQKQTVYFAPSDCLRILLHLKPNLKVKEFFTRKDNWSTIQQTMVESFINK